MRRRSRCHTRPSTRGFIQLGPHTRHQADKLQSVQPGRRYSSKVSSQVGPHSCVHILTASLPKGGPVQTSYEEKLCLYSLYKQGAQVCHIGPSRLIVATEGDIAAPRPGMLDMLGRAKW